MLRNCHMPIHVFAGLCTRCLQRQQYRCAFTSTIAIARRPVNRSLESSDYESSINIHRLLSFTKCALLRSSFSTLTPELSKVSEVSCLPLATFSSCADKNDKTANDAENADIHAIEPFGYLQEKQQQQPPASCNSDGQIEKDDVFIGRASWRTRAQGNYTGRLYVRKPEGSNLTFAKLKELEALANKAIHDYHVVNASGHSDHEILPVINRKKNSVNVRLQVDPTYLAELEAAMLNLPDSILRELEPPLRTFKLQDLDLSQFDAYAPAVKAARDQLQLTSDEQAHQLFGFLLLKHGKFKLTNRNIDNLLTELPKRLKQLLTVLSPGEVISNFALNWYSLTIMQNRITQLQQIGIRRMRAAYLIHFSKVMYCSSEQLKRMQMLSPDVNVLENMLSLLNDMSEPIKQQLIREPLQAEAEQMPLALLNGQLIMRYLNYRLALSSEELERYGNFDFMTSLTLKNVKAVLDFIELGSQSSSHRSEGIPLSLLKATRHQRGYNWRKIIQLNPQQLAKFDYKLQGEFLGQNIRYMIAQKPLIFLSADRLDKVMMLHKHFNLSNETLLSVVNMTCYDRNTIITRLQYWIHVLGRRILNDRLIVKLIMHHLRAIQLRRALANEDLHQLPLAIWSSLFTRMIEYQSQFSYHFSVERRLLLIDLSHKLDTSFKQVAKHLMLHPNWRQFDAKKAQSVFDFCQAELQLSNEQLLKGMYIIVFELSDVQAAYNEICDDLSADELSEWRQNVLFLDLLVYYIERKTCFDLNEQKKHYRRRSRKRSTSKQASAANADNNDHQNIQDSSNSSSFNDAVAEHRI